MGNGIDYAWTRPDLDAMWNAGVRYVLRYVGPPSWGKTITQPEYDALVAKFGAENVAVVFESGNDDAAGGSAAGVANAQMALQYLPAGYPDNMPIFLAADTNYGDITAPVAYFAGGATVIPGRLGAYGQGSLLIACRDAGHTTRHWLSGSTSFPGYADGKAMADIIQGLDGPLPGTDDNDVVSPLVVGPTPAPDPTTKCTEAPMALSDPIEFFGTINVVQIDHAGPLDVNGVPTGQAWLKRTLKDGTQQDDNLTALLFPNVPGATQNYVCAEPRVWVPPAGVIDAGSLVVYLEMPVNSADPGRVRKAVQPLMKPWTATDLK